ncbi:hypothetical protein PROFUN_07642 [Planoprotostelium fungivorum]|uniref:Uncharacterized protein n=1 Tax=Planoprotostelium fungivorum TaxID=1890364 RepID=A0A2P6NK62_9EUKA|nr:hypothetical protein PROFUN_07642 [Planoprotostelium fungivorum]
MEPPCSTAFHYREELHRKDRRRRMRCQRGGLRETIRLGREPLSGAKNWRKARTNL